MQIAILSDIHDHLENLERVLSEVQGMDLLLCLGDLCAPFTLDALADGFRGPVHVTFGNNDGDIHLLHRNAARHPNVSLVAPMGEVEVAGQKLAFVHYPVFAEGLAALGRYDAVFCGHTHKHELRIVGRTVLANPGEVMGRFGEVSYGVWDVTGKQFTRRVLRNA